MRSGAEQPGSNRFVASSIRISARLVDGRTGHQLWSETYDRMVEAPTGNQLAYEEYLRGRDQLRKGNTVEEYQGAIERFDRALALDPAFWRHHFALARVVYEQGRVDETISALDQAIRLAPDNPLPYVSLAAIHYYEGDYLRAAQINRQSLERNPTPRAYSNAGSY